MQPVQALWQLNRECRKCRNLCRTRTQVVCGFGPVMTNMVLVGEAPGENEDYSGEPFVGRAGDLLSSLLKDVGIDRSSVYITNTVKCRPTENDDGKKNRPPADDEIQNCKSWLWEELKLIQPKVVVTLGKVPTKLLLKMAKNFTMGKMVGVPHPVPYMPGPIVPCWHPSYLLQHGRNEIDSAKKALKVAYDIAGEGRRT